MQPEYQNLAAPSQAHDKPASSRSQGGDVEISDAVDDKKHLDTEKHDQKTQVAKVEAKVAEVEAKVAEVEGKMKLIVNFVKGHATVSDLNKGVESLRGWDESDRAGEPREPSARLLSRYKSLEDEKNSLKEEKKSLNQQLVAFQNQLVEFQKRLTLLAQAPPEDGLVEKVDFLVAQAKKTEENRRRDEVRDIQASLLHRGDSVGSSKTTGGSHNLQYNTIVQSFGRPLVCMVCGKVSAKRGDVTVARILKTEEACRKFGVSWIHEDDRSNWLALCGTFSKENEQTCHYKFDAKTMGFVHDNSEKNPLDWKVVEPIGEEDGFKKLKVTRVVELKSNPHRCILHAHMEEVCKRASIRDWLAQLPEVAAFTPREDRVELLDSAALPFIPIANASSHSSSTTSVTPTRAEFATDP